MRIARFPFIRLDYSRDPLKGAGGLSWYERSPSSLSPEEWKALDRALAENVISAFQYVEWKENVRRRL